LSRGGSCRQTCHQLIDAANAKGGSDNITVVLARFKKASEELEADEVEAEISTEPSGAAPEPHLAAATMGA
jgi:serine/threonine protein phosphatase PrpC